MSKLQFDSSIPIKLKLAQMRKGFVRRTLIEKTTQRVPAITIFPTHYQQILSHSSSKILKHRAIVILISLRRLLVIPFGGLHAVDLIPPVRLYPLFTYDSLTLVMSLQTPYISRSIFPQRENKFCIRKPAIEFFVEQTTASLQTTRVSRPLRRTSSIWFLLTLSARSMSYVWCLNPNRLRQ